MEGAWTVFSKMWRSRGKGFRLSLPPKKTVGNEYPRGGLNASSVERA